MDKCQEYLEDFYGKVQGDQVRGYVKKEEPEAVAPAPAIIDQVGGWGPGDVGFCLAIVLGIDEWVDCP